MGTPPQFLSSKMGYGELFRGCSGCTDHFHIKHDKDSIADGRVIVGWLHKIKLRPNGQSRGQRHFQIGVGAWAEQAGKFWVENSFRCPVQEEL